MAVKVTQANRTLVTVGRGDILQEDVDVVVVPSGDLLGGTGIERTLWKAGGFLLSPGRVVETIRPWQKFRAPRLYQPVQHSWMVPETGHMDLLEPLVNEALAAAWAAGARTVAFPAISPGRLGFPLHETAVKAIMAVRRFCHRSESFDEVRFVCCTDREYAVFCSGGQAPGNYGGGRRSLICPVCGRTWDAGAGNWTSFDLDERWLTWLGGPAQLTAAAQAGAVQWACHECLGARRAARADVKRQQYCTHPPYFAYFDVALHCESCRQEFTFAADEQRFWYEDLGFFVQSRPKECAACRRKRRQEKALQKDLSDAIRSLQPGDPGQLAQIARLFLELGNQKKGREYLGRARNLARRTGRHGALLEQLGAMDWGREPS